MYAESNGDQTNILLHSTLGNQLTINSNGANGVRWDVTSTGDLIGHQFTVDAATIDGNGGDGVQFDVANVGLGLLTLTNNNITNSGDDGINVNLTGIRNGPRRTRLHCLCREAFLRHIRCTHIRQIRYISEPV